MLDENLSVTCEGISWQKVQENQQSELKQFLKTVLLREELRNIFTTDFGIRKQLILHNKY